MHSNFVNPFACSGPEVAASTATLFVLRQMSGNFGSNWHMALHDDIHEAYCCDMEAGSF